MPTLGRVPVAQPEGGRAILNVYDGARQLLPSVTELLVTIWDGNQKQQHRDTHPGPSIFFAGLPLFNNFGDDYTFLVYVKGYRQVGFHPVHLLGNVNQVVDLMVLPDSSAFNFADATWPRLGDLRPALKSLFASGAASNEGASNRYAKILEGDGGKKLACLLNITAAMQQLPLPQKTPLDYLKRIIWDSGGPHAIQQDRFYAWADPVLIDQLERAKQQNSPKFANAPFLLHPGATRSYKEIEFGEANLQLTFHENDRLDIDGITSVMVEPDIDYYKNALNHLVLEVAVNAFGSLTDPAIVYMLRWMAGMRAGVQEFDPLYTIEKI